MLYLQYNKILQWLCDVKLSNDQACWSIFETISWNTAVTWKVEYVNINILADQFQTLLLYSK